MTDIVYGACEHYPAVGQTLLKSPSNLAGDLWTEELNDARAKACGEFAKMMPDGVAHSTGSHHA